MREPQGPHASCRLYEADSNLIEVEKLPPRNEELRAIRLRIGQTLPGRDAVLAGEHRASVGDWAITDVTTAPCVRSAALGSATATDGRCRGPHRRHRGCLGHPEGIAVDVELDIVSNKPGPAFVRGVFEQIRISLGAISNFV